MQRAVRPGADQHELRGRDAVADLRKDVAMKPMNRVDVWEIAEIADEEYSRRRRPFIRRNPWKSVHINAVVYECELMRRSQCIAIGGGRDTAGHDTGQKSSLVRCQ